MKYNSTIHHRRSIRLKGYDYSQAGMYFVTICVQNRECLFGEIINREMKLNEYGEIVERAWDELPQHYSNVQLGAFVVMPNHIHGIIVIADVGAGFKPALMETHGTGLRPAPSRQPSKKHGLPEIVRALKTFSARRINEKRNVPQTAVWQRNYYECIIRNEPAFLNISEYIINNPKNWGTGTLKRICSESIPN